MTRWRDLRPDVNVLDQLMPGISGLEAAAQILAEVADQPIVLFTHLRDERLTEAATKVGVRACLSEGNLHGLMPMLAEQVPGG